MIQDLQVGDIGTVLEVTIEDDGVVVDISGTVTREITLEKPDGTSTTYGAVFVTDGVDGKMKYTTTSADILSSAGRWKWQARVKWSASQDWKASVGTFLVRENL